MTLEEATEELINSTEFKEIAKMKTSEGGKYRMMRMRYRKKEINALAMVGLLEKHGYEIVVNRKNKAG